jgi:hypothetical protein
MPIFCDAQAMMEPMILEMPLDFDVYVEADENLQLYQTIHPIMMAFLRPNISVMYPEAKDPSHDPAGIDAVTPP